MTPKSPSSAFSLERIQIFVNYWLHRVFNAAFDVSIFSRTSRKSEIHCHASSRTVLLSVSSHAHHRYTYVNDSANDNADLHARKCATFVSFSSVKKTLKRFRLAVIDGLASRTWSQQKIDAQLESNRRKQYTTRRHAGTYDTGWFNQMGQKWTKAEYYTWSGGVPAWIHSLWRLTSTLACSLHSI